MERRVLLAVILSLVVLYGYQALFPPPPEPAQAPIQTSKTATAPAASAAEPANPSSSIQPAMPPAEAPQSDNGAAAADTRRSTTRPCTGSSRRAARSSRAGS